MQTFEPESKDWRRSEPRIPIDLGSMPFLGSRKNGQPSFVYLLSDVSASGVGLIVPRRGGMVPLEIGETVNDQRTRYRSDRVRHRRIDAGVTPE